MNSWFHYVQHISTLISKRISVFGVPTFIKCYQLHPVTFVNIFAMWYLLNMTSPTKTFLPPWQCASQLSHIWSLCTNKLWTGILCSNKNQSYRLGISEKHRSHTSREEKVFLIQNSIHCCILASVCDLISYIWHFQVL